jgi:dTDP-4-dehydrorhamnose 3,5-epimerase
MKKFSFPIFADNRGIFTPLEIEDDWVQSNISINKKRFTFRGLHFQVGSHAQTKSVRVIEGKILDIIVCIDEDSSDYLQVKTFELKAGEGINVPKGYAHSFITLKNNTIVQYLVDEPYWQPSERSILWSSIPKVKKIIEDVVKDRDLIISDRDQCAIEFSEYESQYE